MKQNKEGVDQVNAAIRDIENTYQSNAAITEESAASANELSQQALSLNNSIRELAELCGNDVSPKNQESAWTASPRKTVASRTPVANNNSFDFQADRASARNEVDIWN